ncbi:MAG TPA: VanW family protein [Actinomycetota bacterium]|nr:VanW family protein [Actinomycetota bacterium]
MPGPIVHTSLLSLPSKAADPPDQRERGPDTGTWPWDPWQPSAPARGAATVADGAATRPAPGSQAAAPADSIPPATQGSERPPAWSPPTTAPAAKGQPAPPAAGTGGGRPVRVLGLPRPLLAAALALILVLGLVVADTALAAGSVRRGVTVGGIDLGGLGQVAARAKLAAAAQAVGARPLVLRHSEARLELPRSQAGIQLDLDDSVAAAFEVGRSGMFDLNRLRTWFGGVDLPWSARLDRPSFGRAVARLDAQIRQPIKEPALRVTGAQVELVDGTPGRGVDAAGAERALLAAADRPAGAEVAIPISAQRPTVGQAAAQAALDQARKLLSAPVAVTAAGRRASLPPAALAAGLRTRVQGGRLLVALDPKTVDRLLHARAPFAYTTPRDASFQPAGSRIRLLPGVKGSTVDPTKAAAALLAAGGKDGARTAALPVVTSDPKLTTEAAKALGVNEVISRFTTTFSASDAPRVHNISLIAAAVDGSLVMPGQVFSMNAATGERTPGKGYRTAKVIKEGEIVPGLGGGVCQAGTTMFNAVFFAGLPVVERRNHSLHISHYPMGRDATLNWPSTDLKFRNDSRYGIYITAVATSASMTVTLWSTSRGYQVNFTTSDPYNFRSPPTKFEDDPTLAVGQQKVESNGSAGFDVTVNRTVTQNGQVVRKDSFVSNYVPWSKVVHRGTKPAGPAPPGRPPAPGA